MESLLMFNLLNYNAKTPAVQTELLALQEGPDLQLGRDCSRLAVCQRPQVVRSCPGNGELSEKTQQEEN